MASLPDIRLKLVIGGHAMKYHLVRKTNVAEAVSQWKDQGDDLFVLPHPSWRNTAWLKRNPWFAEDVLPRLRARLGDILNE